MAFLIQKICLLLITILLLNIVFLPPLTIFMPKPLLSLDILNNRKHYPSPRVCVIIIIRSKKLLPRWGRIARNTPDDRSPAHTESAALHQLLSAKAEYKAPSKISCSVSMDAITDRHLLTTLRASSLAFSGTRARGISYDTLGLSPNSVFPKGFGSMSNTTQESCFTEITNCKLFFLNINEREW